MDIWSPERGPGRGGPAAGIASSCTVLPPCPRSLGTEARYVSSAMPSSPGRPGPCGSPRRRRRSWTGRATPLGRYCAEYPRVSLRLREHFTAGVIEMLLDGTAGVGFLRDGDLTGHRAYDATVSLCEEHGFRPHVVQEAPQWLTILRLVGAGLGVTLAPACVAPLAPPAAVCRRLRGTRARSQVDLACREGDDRAVVKAFRAITREIFAGLGPPPVSPGGRPSRRYPPGHRPRSG